MNIAVVGTGYVGLVSGVCFAEMGNDVTCVDIDAAKVESLREGRLTIYEPGLEVYFDRGRREGRLVFTTDLAEAVQPADVVFLALPTPPGEGGAADLKYVLGVAADAGRLCGGGHRDERECEDGEGGQQAHSEQGEAGGSGGQDACEALLMHHAMRRDRICEDDVPERQGERRDVSACSGHL